MSDITVLKNQHNGSLELMTIHQGVLVSKVYYFYSKRAAIADFREYLKGA